MLGETIKQLRMEKGLTQKELAEQLFVTPQAVSRWENGEVEPSVGTLSLLAKIFGVSVSALVGEEVAVAQAAAPAQPVQPVVAEQVTKPVAAPQPPKPVLAVCESCNKPLYEASDIVRERFGGSGTRVLCKDCEKKQKEAKKRAAIEYSAGQRKKSYIWSGIITALLLIFSIAGSGAWDAQTTLTFCGISILFFPFISCLFLKNNFVGEMFAEVLSWGFVKFPGLIFTLDLDGIIWLLTVKLAFWILGFLLGVACALLALVLCLIVSVFVYPFALRKSFLRPDETETF